MNSEIEDMIKKCPTWLTFRNTNPTSQLLTIQFQIKPGQKLLYILLAYIDIIIYYRSIIIPNLLLKCWKMYNLHLL